MTRGQPAQRVRIIGGQWRRTPLPVVDAPGLRPTPDRVRETLFNWLGQDLDGVACADLFAGTGALGLEAASRGAREVWMAETHPGAQRALAGLIERLRATDTVRLHRGDALSLLDRLTAQRVRLDLVFLDPPFHQGCLETVVPRLAPLLADTAWVYIESESPLTEARCQAWLGSGARLVRQAGAGQVHYHLLRIESTPPGAQESP